MKSKLHASLLTAFIGFAQIAFAVAEPTVPANTEQTVTQDDGKPNNEVTKKAIEQRRADKERRAQEVDKSLREIFATNPDQKAF